MYKHNDVTELPHYKHVLYAIKHTA